MEEVFLKRGKSNNLRIQVHRVVNLSEIKTVKFSADLFLEMAVDVDRTYFRPRL